MPPRTKPVVAPAPLTSALPYPRVSVAICASPERTGVSEEVATMIRDALAAVGCEGLLSYNPPLTHLDAVTLMGMEFEEEGGAKFGTDYLFEDRNGRKVRCKNNVRNRPLHSATVEARVQEILNRRWRLNGETGIIGKDGIVLDFQHSLVALYLAYQDWLTVKDLGTGQRKWVGEYHWPDEKYPDGPTMDKIVVYGIENSDAVVNTINTGRPRSLADVLYRCPYFDKLPPRDPQTCVDRVTAAKATASAIDSVWRRTGMAMSAFGKIRTHSEAVSWIEGHGGSKSRLLEAVKHILEENADGRITKYVTLGYAAAMLYLMGQSDTPDDRVEKYYAADERTGKKLVWSAWERACKFWSAFGKGEVEDADEASLLAATTSVLEALNGETTDGAGRSREKDFTIVRSWAAFRERGTVTMDEAEVKYTPFNLKSGLRSLDWTPSERSVGGIDLGNERIVSSADDGIEPSKDVTDEVENGKHEEEKVKSDPSPKPSIENAAKDGIETLLARVHTENPDFGPLFVKTATGSWSVWGDLECGIVAPHTSKKPKMHPRGVRCLTFKPDEVETVVDALTDIGAVVAFVAEVVGNPAVAYTVEKVCRPSKKGKKGGTK